MSEEKKERTTDNVRADYANLCARAGQLQYEIKAKESDLAKVNQEMSNLNQEFMALSAKAAELEKLKEEAKKQAEAESTKAAGDVVPLKEASSG